MFESALLRPRGAGWAHVSGLVALLSRALLAADQLRMARRNALDNPDAQRSSRGKSENGDKSRKNNSNGNSKAYRLVKGPLVAVFDPDVGATVKMHACALECVREESALLASFLQSMSQQGNDAPTLPGTYSHWQDLFSHIVLSSDPGRLAAVVQTPDLPQDSLLALFQLARVWQMPQLLALYRSELTARLSIDTVVGCFARALAAAPTPILLPGGAGVAQDGVTMAVGPHTVSAVEGSEGGVPASGSGPAVGALEGTGGAESQDQQQQFCPHQS